MSVDLWLLSHDVPVEPHERKALFRKLPNSQLHTIVDLGDSEWNLEHEHFGRVALSLNAPLTAEDFGFS